MRSTITRNVKEIPAEEKRTLEGMLGAPLANDQQVFIFAYTPGALPDEAARGEAKKRLQQTLSSNQAFATKHGVTSAEANDAVSEGLRHTRRRT